MATGRMHDDELSIDAALVDALVAEQHPEWARLAITPVSTPGTDNALYRLGDELVVRVPRTSRAAARLAIEQRWLPTFETSLPLPVPTLVAIGEPGALYPLGWSVLRWIHGVDLWDAAPLGGPQLATDLASFVGAIRRIGVRDAPRGHRAGPVSAADDAIRASLDRLPPSVDRAAASAAWDDASRLPSWRGPACWTHGDLHPTNLVVRGGRLGAVLDFGCAGLGDPAADLLPAWAVLSAADRLRYRDLLGSDEEEWARGRAWALRLALTALPYYLESNQRFAAVAQRTIEQVLDDLRLRP